MSDGFQFGDRIKVVDGQHDGRCGIFVNQFKEGRCRVILELGPRLRLIETVSLEEIRHD